MRTNLLLATVVLAAGVLLAGCRAHIHGGRHWRPGRHHVVWKPVAGHVHTAHCGHFHHGGKWYHHAGHVHAAGCGHVLRSGIWIVAP